MEIIMKFQFRFNETYAFFVFVCFLAFCAFMLSGAPLSASFLSAVFIYIFLRFAYFLWNIILRLFGRAGGGSGGTANL